MKNQAYRMALLYDFYGDMLTDRQKEFYDLYYNEDLSLAEIAENYGITRQGVRDVIVRAEAVLTELEDKTGIIRRFHKMQEQFAQIADALDVSLWVLLNGEALPVMTLDMTEKERRLIGEYRRLTGSEREAVDHVIQVYNERKKERAGG